MQEPMSLADKRTYFFKKRGNSKILVFWGAFFRFHRRVSESHNRFLTRRASGVQTKNWPTLFGSSPGDRRGPHKPCCHPLKFRFDQEETRGKQNETHQVPPKFRGGSKRDAPHSRIGKTGSQPPKKMRNDSQSDLYR
jgi:hypothetical protein